MAKNSVQDWSVDAEQNEDVGGVDIRQTANGANIGPGLREVMAQIKEFIVAASFDDTATFNTIVVSSAAPTVRFIETDVGTNIKMFRLIQSGGDIFFQAMTDAGVSADNVLIFRRGAGAIWESIDARAQLLLTPGLGMGASFLGDTDTGVGQLADNTVSIFAANDAVPRVTVSATAVDIARPTNITGNTTINGAETVNGNVTINGTLTVTG